MHLKGVFLNDRAGPHGTHEVGFADHVAGGGDQNLENLESTVSEWNWDTMRPQLAPA
jgi:hypothetical protein